MDSASGRSASGQSDCGSLDNSSFGLLHSLDTPGGLWAGARSPHDESLSSGIQNAAWFREAKPNPACE